MQRRNVEQRLPDAGGEVSDLKELLPLAAKAMGYYVRGWIGDRISVDFGNGYRGEWRPDESPGDGAEMEDKLKISVMRSPDGKVWSHIGAYEHFAIEEPADHPTEGHARRWASLRVAAEIGRSMK